MAASVSPSTRPDAVRIHGDDNVAVAIHPLTAGETVEVAGARVVLRSDVPAGHKFALRHLEQGEPVVKYGFPIGALTEAVEPGGWIHSHNLKTQLEGMLGYTYSPSGARPRATGEVPTFQGYRRSDGKVGTRNEIWILNTVGCVNFVADGIAKSAGALGAEYMDGVHAFGHPFGCSQLGDDLSHTQAVLAGLMRNPNAGGVLVLGLGCENNQMDALLARAGEYRPQPHSVLQFAGRDGRTRKRPCDGRGARESHEGRSA
jgi:Altronate dehydratase